MFGRMSVKYPDIIAKELKNIKPPVTMSRSPVITETTLMCRLNLWKCLRKVFMPRDVRIKGMASPSE
jgi:hypothetical protein